MKQESEWGKHLKKWIIFIVIWLFPMTAIAKEPDELYAQSAVLMDAESGRILFGKNEEDKMANASTTKIMTCILALEHEKPESTVIFSSYACSQPKVHLNASQGETFRLKDILYSLMLESHNDSAVAVAECVSGSVETFAKLMNQKAKEIGCQHTYFITPNGLDAEDEVGEHGTTAADLAKIMAYCVLKSPKKKEFLEITRTESYSFSNLEGTRQYQCSNKNAYLNMQEEALSGKTGFTSKAGYCYVGAVQSGDRTFVVSLLACGWPNDKQKKWIDMKKLTTYALEEYHYEEVEVPEFVHEVEVVNGMTDQSGLFDIITIPVNVSVENHKVLKRKDEVIDVVVTQKKEMQAPIYKNQIVGNVSYYLNGEKLCSDPIVCGFDVPERNFSWCFRKLVETYGL